MKTIQKRIDTVAKIAGEQRCSPSSNYRKTSLSMETACPEGRLLYHSLTGELLLLEGTEAENWPIDPERRETMIKHWFLVPEDFDELRFCEQIKIVARMMKKEKKSVRHYIIFTTTDCNARCFYCFEHGQRRISMTEKTARDTADYMLKHANGEKITIRWFGGEPLYNAKVIDIISRELRDHGAECEATMVSNAYLFDTDTVKKAKELWNLRRVLVTIDGTEEVYNRTKAFIYRDGSAYQRVLSNIDSLLDADISVTVNLSVDAQNAQIQFELAEELGKRFGGREGFVARAGLLIEYVGKLHHFESEYKALDTVKALNDKLTSYGIREKRMLWSGLMLNSCMADNPHSATILPDGRIGRCEHFGDSEEVGSIYGGDWDAERFDSWKKLRSAEEECQRCPHYPHCMRLVKCNAVPEVCSELLRGQRMQDLHDRMRNTYEKWLEQQGGN